ncbi:MAG: hypothetical protein OEY06_12080 [Gammaproteobacteria bacterium]|nr:hypothetical protein [Gammaproteobacteria bacterium]
MKRIFISIFLICTTSLTLSSCTYLCGCDKHITKGTKTPSPQTIAKNISLVDECALIDEGIADSKTLAKKMSKSRYAIQYHAMSRERISEFQNRAKEIGCK